MSFSQFLEAREQRAIFYHGTSSKRLPAILSQGLIPFPKKKSWADDPDASFDKASRASLGGIYVTRNLMTALSAAWRTSQQDDSERLLVCLDLHPYSLVADEDDFLPISRIPVPGLLTTPYSISNIYWTLSQLKDAVYMKKERSDPRGKARLKEIETYIKEVKNLYIESTLQSLLRNVKPEERHPELIRRLTNILRDRGFEITLMRQMAYADKGSLDYASRNYEGQGIKPLPIPNKQDAERAYAVFMDKLTRVLKRLAYPAYRENDFMKTARILRPVGFHGKDKIVCIIEIIKPSDEDKKKNIYDKIKVVYGTVPTELRKDWEERIGKWRQI